MTCNFLFCYLVYRGEHGEFKVTDPRANATNDLQCKVLSPKSPHVVYYCWYTRFMARFQRIRGLFDSAMLLKLMIQLVLNKPRLRFQCLFIVRQFLVCKVQQSMRPGHGSQSQCIAKASDDYPEPFEAFTI